MRSEQWHHRLCWGMRRFCRCGMPKLQSGPAPPHLCDWKQAVWLTPQLPNAPLIGAVNCRSRTWPSCGCRFHVVRLMRRLPCRRATHIEKGGCQWAYTGDSAQSSPATVLHRPQLRAPTLLHTSTIAKQPPPSTSNGLNHSNAVRPIGLGTNTIPKRPPPCPGLPRPCDVASMYPTQQWAWTLYPHPPPPTWPSRIAPFASCGTRITRKRCQISPHSVTRRSPGCPGSPQRRARCPPAPSQRSPEASRAARSAARVGCPRSRAARTVAPPSTRPLPPAGAQGRGQGREPACAGGGVTFMIRQGGVDAARRGWGLCAATSSRTRGVATGHCNCHGPATPRQCSPALLRTASGTHPHPASLRRDSGGFDPPYPCTHATSSSRASPPPRRLPRPPSTPSCAS